MRWVVLAAALGLVEWASGRPDGSPYCTLEPGHGALSRPTTAGAAAWKFSNFRGDPIDCYAPDIPVLVKLVDTQFHGFVIKGPAESQFDDLPGPVFRKYKWAQFSNCATHREPELREKIVLKWTAKRALGTITFRAVTFLASNKQAPTRSGVYTETRATLKQCGNWQMHSEPLGKDAVCPAFVERLDFAHVYECDVHGMCPTHMRCCHGQQGGQICYPPGGRSIHHSGKCGQFKDQHRSWCPTEVQRDPDSCQKLDSKTATQCRFSCCREWLTTPAPLATAPTTPRPTWRPANPDPSCRARFSNRRSLENCGRWLSSDVGRRNCLLPDSFEARNCQQLCCELGKPVPATPPPFVPEIVTRPSSTTTTEPPCEDSWTDCARFLGNCDSDAFMRTDCRWTCGLCKGGQRRPIPLVRKLSQKDCSDSDSGCWQWSTQCGRSRYVDDHCPKTCGACQGHSRPGISASRDKVGASVSLAKASESSAPSCDDDNAKCAQWRSLCREDVYTRTHCWKTCGLCPSSASRTLSRTATQRPARTTRDWRLDWTTKSRRPATTPRPTTARPWRTPTRSWRRATWTTRKSVWTTPAPATAAPWSRASWGQDYNPAALGSRWEPRTTERPWWQTSTTPRPWWDTTTRKAWWDTTTPKPWWDTTTTPRPWWDTTTSRRPRWEEPVEPRLSEHFGPAPFLSTTGGRSGGAECRDLDPTCPAWGASKCSSYPYVRQHCLLTCSLCSNNFAAPSQQSSDDRRECGDTTASCSFFASRCGSNDAWVERNCRATCGLCGGSAASGASWRAPQRAGQSPVQRAGGRSSSAKRTGAGCGDGDARCPTWVRECGTSDWVRRNCASTCGQCALGGPRVAPSRTRPTPRPTPRPRQTPRSRSQQSWRSSQWSQGGGGAVGEAGACRDADPNCQHWTNFCADYAHIRAKCRLTCRQC